MRKKITFKFNKKKFTVNPNTKYKVGKMEHQGLTPLMYLVINTEKFSVQPNYEREFKKFLVRHSDQLNDRDYEKCTALTLTCYHGNIPNMVNTAKMLIEAGANVNIQNMYTETPLMIACMYGYKNIVELLVDGGALLDEMDIEGDTALMKSLRNISIAKILVEHGANIDLTGCRDATILHCVMNSRYINSKTKTDLTKLLLEHGTDVNKKALYGYTPLMIACERIGKHDTCRLLNEYNSGIEKETIKVLLDSNCNLKIINKSRNMISDQKKMSGFEFICKYTDEELIEYCFNKHKYYDEYDLIKCIIVAKHQRAVAKFLANIYYDKLIYFKLY